MYDSFRPGKFWYDTDGKPIQAHGGSVTYVDGIFFWYGENKENVTGRASGSPCRIWHGGVRLYSSKDLYNWKDEGVIAVSDDPGSPLYPSRVMDRPHILRRPQGDFVLWIKTGGVIGGGELFAETCFSVFAAEDIRGPYTFVRQEKTFAAGDFDFFDFGGKTYAVFEKPHTELICAELQEDLTAFTGKFSSHLPRPFPPYAREAPAVFERNGRYFVLTSGTTGYFPNPSEFAGFDAPHGEWTDIGLACVNDRENNSFRAQFSGVFRHPTVRNLYIALGDRWLNDLPPDMPDAGVMFESFFHPGYAPDAHYDLKEYTDENTSMATYVWLPILFDENGRPYISWKNEWKTEDFG